MPNIRKRRKANKKRYSKESVAPEETNEAYDEVKSIYYVDEEGGQIDMTTIDRKRKRGKWIIFGAIIVLVLSAIAYIGYRVFQQDTGSNDGSVQVSITADEKVASGDLVTIEVEYTNTKNVSLSTATVELFYPQGFYVESVSPDTSDADQRVWNAENIAPGTGGKITITGQLVGGKDDVKDISALVTYRPSNFSHDFQESAKTQVQITSSLVSMDVTTPSQIQSGQEFEYKLSYTNSSSAPLKNVKLQVAYPEGFNYKSASPEATSAKREWLIDEIAPNETQELTITGTLSGDSGDTKELVAELGIVEIDNSFTVQIEKRSQIVIVNPEIDLFISAPNMVNAGEGVPLTVSVNNTSDVEMKDVQVQLKFSGPFFREEEYSFDPIEILAPNSTFELQYTTTLEDRIDQNNVVLRVDANALSATVEGNTVDLPDTANVEMKTRGGFTVSANGRYYDDDLKKIGNGPLPPVVGEETTYIVQWNMETILNEMDGVNVSTTLPEEVKWKNNASKGVTYNSATHQVTFSKDALPPEDDRSLYFAVSVTPKSGDVGSLLVLTEQTVVSATDAFTHEPISYELERITTDLPDDEGAAGKGEVAQD